MTIVAFRSSVKQEINAKTDNTDCYYSSAKGVSTIGGISRDATDWFRRFWRIALVSSSPIHWCSSIQLSQQRLGFLECNLIERLSNPRLYITAYRRVMKHLQDGWPSKVIRKVIFDKTATDNLF